MFPGYPVKARAPRLQANVITRELNTSGHKHERSSDGWAKNQLGERRLGKLFFGRQTIGQQAKTV